MEATDAVSVGSGFASAFGIRHRGPVPKRRGLSAALARCIGQIPNGGPLDHEAPTGASDAHSGKVGGVATSLLPKLTVFLSTVLSLAEKNGCHFLTERSFLIRSLCFTGLSAILRWCLF